MEKSLRIELVTPDKLVLSEDVEYVAVPGIEGEIGILSNHIPLLTALNIGHLYYKINGKNYYAFVGGGFAEVSANKVTVLAESAEKADEIDPSRAEKARERAEKRLASSDEGVDRTRAEVALHRAISRLSLVR